MEYNCEAWLGYDHRFRQDAAALTNAVWAKIDATLWNKAFTGQVRAQCCQYCFSLTHKSEDCDWADTPTTSCASKIAPTMPNTMPNKPAPQSRQTLCLEPLSRSRLPVSQLHLPIALTTSACTVQMTTRSYTKTIRHYTASVGEAVVQEVAGNLTQPQSSERNKEPPTATNPTEQQEKRTSTVYMCS